jgi:hypothetical protein
MTIEAIIGNYLKQNGFNYNNNEKCYIIGTPSEKDANIDMVTHVVENMHSHIMMTTYPDMYQCLEYEIEGNQLIIKAYILNAFSNVKLDIYSNVNSNLECKEYYNNLQTELFNKLQHEGIVLASIETEKVVDGSNLKLFKKTLLFVLPVIILFTIITIIAYCSSH